jgi:hypothetical protein
MQWLEASETFESETELWLGIRMKDGKSPFPVRVRRRLKRQKNGTWTESYKVKVSHYMSDRLRNFFMRKNIAPHLYELLVRQYAKVIHYGDLDKQVHGLKETAKCLLSLLREKRVWKTLSYFLTPEQEQALTTLANLTPEQEQAVVTLANMDTSILDEVKPIKGKQPKHRRKDPYVESLGYLVRALDSVTPYNGDRLTPHQKAFLLTSIGVPLKGRTLRQFVKLVRNLQYSPNMQND